MLEIGHQGVQVAIKVEQAALQVWQGGGGDAQIFGAGKCRRRKGVGHHHAPCVHGLCSGFAQPQAQQIDHLFGHGLPVVFAFHKVSQGVQAGLDAGNQIHPVGADELFALHGVAQQAQQVGHAVFKAFALGCAGVAGVAGITLKQVGAHVALRLLGGFGFKQGADELRQVAVNALVIGGHFAPTLRDEQGFAEGQGGVVADFAHRSHIRDAQCLAPQLFACGHFVAVVLRDGRGHGEQAQIGVAGADAAVQPRQGLVHLAQAAQVLGAVAAHQHGGIGQGSGEQAAQVGQAGAGVDEHMPETFAAQLLEQGGKQIAARWLLAAQQVGPVDAEVEGGGIGIVAMRGQDEQLAERGGLHQLAKLAQVLSAGWAQLVFLPIQQPVKKAGLDGSLVAQCMDVVQAGGLHIHVPQQGFALAGQGHRHVGGQQGAANAAFVTVEADDGWAHGVSWSGGFSKYPPTERLDGLAGCKGCGGHGGGSGWGLAAEQADPAFAPLALARDVAPVFQHAQNLADAAFAQAKLLRQVLLAHAALRCGPDAIEHGVLLEQFGHRLAGLGLQAQAFAFQQALKGLPAVAHGGGFGGGGCEVVRHFAQAEHFLHAFGIVGAQKHGQRPFVQVQVELVHLCVVKLVQAADGGQHVGRLATLDEVFGVERKPVHGTSPKLK